MKVFATKFLEAPSSDKTEPVELWNWKPESEVDKIYGSGANTASRSSTYAAEKDNRDDDDRPNEGLFIA